MPIFTGAQPTANAAFGPTPVEAMYAGDVLVYSSFDPLAWFALGEQGIWLDPSDLSTMFQNAGGTVPVTAVGQPVGLILDKRLGLALGPELAVDPDFDNPIAWPPNGPGIAITGGELVFTNATTLNFVSQVIAATDGLFCEVTIVVSSLTAGALNVQFNSGSGALISEMTAPGTYTFRFRQEAGGNTFFIQCVGTTTASVASVSVKAVLGNHAHQTILDRCPLFGQDGSGRNNLQFDGVNDVLLTGFVDMTGQQQLIALIGFAIDQLVGPFNMLWTHTGPASLGSAGCAGVTFETGPAFYHYHSSNADKADVPAPASFYGVPHVHASAVDFASPTIQTELPVFRQDKANLSRVQFGNQYAGTLANNKITLGAFNAGQAATDGRVYQFILRAAATSAADLAKGEAFVAKKSGVVVPFTPADLFKNNENGLWFKVGDLPTMFQDAAGMTPVTALGQPLGLLLDKRLETQRGPELAPPTTSTAGWAATGGATVASVGGEIQISSAGAAFAGVGATIPGLVVGKTYDVSYTIRKGTAVGTVGHILGDSVGTHTHASASVTYRHRWQVTVLPRFLDVYFAAAEAPGATAFVSNFSVREIPGNHARQATAPARPILPADGYRLVSDHIDDDIFIDADMFALPYMDMWVNTPYGHYKTSVQGCAGLPLNGATEMVARASFSAEDEAKLATYFGTPRVFLVLRVNATTMHSLNSLLAAEPINVTFIGANGVSVTKPFQGLMGPPDLATDGLTAPMTTVFPASMIGDPTLSQFRYAGGGITGSAPYLEDLTGLQWLYFWGHRVVGPLPRMHPNAPLTNWAVYGVGALSMFGEFPPFDNYPNLVWLQAVGGTVRTKAYIYGPMPTLAAATWAGGGYPQIVETRMSGPLPTCDAAGPSTTYYNIRSNDLVTGPIPDISHMTGLNGWISVRNQPVTGNIPNLSPHTLLPTFYCGDTLISGYDGGGVPASLATFHAHNCQLTAAAVNLILADFVAAGRPTGTLRLEGGTNAAPTGQGITDKATLISRGWTVTTN